MAAVVDEGCVLIAVGAWRVLGAVHGGDEVREMEEDAGAQDGEGAGAIEGEEVDATLAGAAGTDIGAEIELGEGADGGDLEGRQVGESLGDFAHPEGDDADPGVAIVGVDFEASAEGWREE